TVLVLVNKYESYRFGRFKITATPASHSDPFSVGCLLETAEKKVYISGDTLYTDELAEEIRLMVQKKIDIVMICINGKLGNMNWREAVDVVVQLKPRLAIPMHYGMFAENTADPEPFIKAVERFGIKGFIMTPGETKTMSELVSEIY
ncbi:MAG: MBL fold metallo-hydrolase, partial [Bacteroidales bacterium]|nr:MBL fold metallo-hydrolase [Bacteroidales bacterium]